MDNDCWLTCWRCLRARSLWGHSVPRPPASVARSLCWPASRSPSSSDLITLSSLSLSQLSLSLSHDCCHSSGSWQLVSCQLSLILLQLLLTISPVWCCWSGGPGAVDISVLCQFYCSHRHERSPVLTAWPAPSPQTHMGEPVTADFLWSELCQGRGQQTNRLGEIFNFHIIDD